MREHFRHIVLGLGLVLTCTTLQALSPSVVDGLTLSFPQSVNLSQNTLYVPFRLVGRLIAVEARVDTLEGTFFLDTGASRLLLNDNYFDHDRRRSGVAGLGTTGFTGTQLTRDVDTLQWDIMYFEDLQADVVDLTHIEDKKNVRLIGILGYDVFKDFEVFLDYQLRQVVLTRLDDQGRRIELEAIFDIPYDSMDFRLQGHVIVVDATVRDVKLRLGLDSGAELNLIDRRVRKRVLQNFELLRRVTMSGVGNREVEAMAGVLRDVYCGNQHSVGMRTLLTSLDDINRAYNVQLDGIIGYEFLFNKRTLINYKRGKLFFFKPRMP